MHQHRMPKDPLCIRESLALRLVVPQGALHVRIRRKTRIKTSVYDKLVRDTNASTFSMITGNMPGNVLAKTAQSAGNYTD